MVRVVCIKPIAAISMLLVTVLGLGVPPIDQVCVDKADSSNQHAAGHGVRTASASY